MPESQRENRTGVPRSIVVLNALDPGLDFLMKR